MAPYHSANPLAFSSSLHLLPELFTFPSLSQKCNCMAACFQGAPSSSAVWTPTRTIHTPTSALPSPPVHARTTAAPFFWILFIGVGLPLTISIVYIVNSCVLSSGSGPVSPPVCRDTVCDIQVSPDEFVQNVYLHVARLNTF